MTNNISIEILHIDCLEYLRNQPDNAFDLAIVDPPYGIGEKCFEQKKRYTSTWTETYNNDFSARPSPEYFAELFRVAANSIIWGANHLCDLFNAAGPGWIVWDKQTTFRFSDCELAYTTFKQSLRRFTYQWNGRLQGGIGDARRKERRIHPHQKPIILYEWLLTNYAVRGQRILDTHLGSGSSAIAAHRFGCDFVGCEISNTYIDAFFDRFKHETAQFEMSL